jgi:hypothetical protein
MKILGYFLVLIGLVAAMISGICVTPFGETQYHSINYDYVPYLEYSTAFWSLMTALMLLVLAKEFLGIFSVSVILTFVLHGTTYGWAAFGESLGSTLLLIALCAHCMTGGLIMIWLSARELKLIYDTNRGTLSNLHAEFYL